jgi:hypothetical protein
MPFGHLIDLSPYSSFDAGPFASCCVYCYFMYFEGSFFQIGSTEWVEENLADLHSDAVAYLNVDCAVQGAGLFAGATPQLDKVLIDVTRQVGRVSCCHTSVQFRASGQRLQFTFGSRAETML